MEATLKDKLAVMDAICGAIDRSNEEEMVYGDEEIKDAWKRFTAVHENVTATAAQFIAFLRDTELGSLRRG
jgi:hypothetical protein